MKYFYLLILPILLLISACTNESGARMGLFTATAPVYAILHDDLFTGETVGYLDRSGTIDIQSAIDPEIKCVGEFHYTGTKTGVASLLCNDGAEAEIKFNALTNLSGYGYGKSTRGPVSFTYGLTVEKSQQYLKLPEGKKIDTSNEQPRLIEL
ncbi:uncharacterized protein METZ01_LOCUS265658 [marine metagenome]|uniref:Lipoprotein n=1 Tax=marine metagenome TaxID=408172 RepID=A0A382JK71_9ZZZZ